MGVLQINTEKMGEFLQKRYIVRSKMIIDRSPVPVRDADNCAIWRGVVSYRIGGAMYAALCSCWIWCVVLCAKQKKLRLVLNFFLGISDI